MKIFGRVMAILIASIISVFAVQRFIKRVYQSWGKKYITIRNTEDTESGEE